MAEFNWELSWSWDMWSLLFLRAMFTSLKCLAWTSWHHSGWTIVWFIFFTQPLFYPFLHSLNSKEVCFTRHVHGALLPLCPLNPSHLTESASTSSTKPTWRFLFTCCIRASDGCTSAPSCSHRVLFIILSCGVFSCAVVLRTAWPCSWVLIPWTYFCGVLRCLLLQTYVLFSCLNFHMRMATFFDWLRRHVKLSTVK